MRSKNVEVVKERWSDGLGLEICDNGWERSCMSKLDVEDLKRMGKVIGKGIRKDENKNKKRG